MKQGPSYLNRDHGGGIDAAIAAFGGVRKDWIDLSTGINPIPYPVPDFSSDVLTQLPDTGLYQSLETAARAFWNIPENMGVVPASGASAFISLLPRILQGTTARTSHPTYNEHRASFEAAGWQMTDGTPDVDISVHPNNPDGRLAMPNTQCKWQIIDESFCDICPDASFVPNMTNNMIVLKSFGKFWGLAGLRLGFVIAPHALCLKLQNALGPWAVSGPALVAGAQALSDPDWAKMTRQRLATDCKELTTLMRQMGAQTVGGTDLFQLYAVDDAQDWQAHLARHHIWTRIFPYSKTYLRLGITTSAQLNRLKAALNVR